MNSSDENRAQRERMRSSVDEWQPNRGMTGEGDRWKARVAFCETQSAPWSPAPFQDYITQLLLNVKYSLEKGGNSGETEGGRGPFAPSFHSNFLPPSPDRPSHSCRSVCGRVCHPTAERPQTVNADKINFLTLIPLEAGGELLEFCTPLAGPTGRVCPPRPDCFQIALNSTRGLDESLERFFHSFGKVYSA